MKKNAIIYIDDTHAQVTKAFEKQARIFGTPEYREWRAYRQDFPSAQMVTKTCLLYTSSVFHRWTAGKYNPGGCGSEAWWQGPPFSIESPLL